MKYSLKPLCQVLALASMSSLWACASPSGPVQPLVTPKAPGVLVIDPILQPFLTAPGDQQQYGHQATGLLEYNVVLLNQGQGSMTLSYTTDLFDDSNRALDQARALDDKRVDFWVRNLSQQRVVVNNGGMARIPEIRRELLEAWRLQEGKDARLALFRRGLPLLVSAVLILVAVALTFARRAERPEPAAASRSLGRWRRALLPGFRSAEAGEGGRVYGALLVPLALVMLPFFQGIGYRIPWGYDPGNVVSWIVAILGLVVWFGARLRLEQRNEI